MRVVHWRRCFQIIVVKKINSWGGDGTDDGLHGDDGSTGDGEESETELKTRFDTERLEKDLKKAMIHARLMWMNAKAKNGNDDLIVWHTLWKK